MKKDELVAFIQGKKAEKVAAVSAEFDSLIEAAQSLEVDAGPVGSDDVEALKAQLADLQSKYDALVSKEANEAAAIGKVKEDVASV